MYRKYKIVDDFWCYFVTFSTIKWIRIFDYEEPRNIFINSVKFLQHSQGLQVHAYVIMPNHVHMIVSDKNKDNKRLKDVMTSLRSYSAKKIIEVIKNKTPKFLPILKKHNLKDRSLMLWQPGIWPKGIEFDEMYWQKIEYIHNNPVNAGLVELPEEWTYSSARQFLCDGDGPIDIFIPN